MGLGLLGSAWFTGLEGENSRLGSRRRKGVGQQRENWGRGSRLFGWAAGKKMAEQAKRVRGREKSFSFSFQIFQSHL
jgi:hypothetical protein